MKAKPWMALTIVFVSGLLVGFYGGRIAMVWRVKTMIESGPSAIQDYFYRSLDRHLDFTPEQDKVVMQALDKAAKSFDKIRLKHAGEIYRNLDQIFIDIRPALNERQLEKMDNISRQDLLPAPIERPNPANTDVNSHSPTPGNSQGESEQ